MRGCYVLLQGRNRPAFVVGFPLTVKAKCEPSVLYACSSVVPSDERVWAEWLIREVGVIFCFVFRCSLVKGVGCKGFYRFIALF